MIALVVMVIVILILTVSISVNIPAFKIGVTHSNFEEDINRLNERIETYYSQYEKLPTINKYTNVSMFQDIKNVNDGPDYYVIDLAVIGMNDLHFGIAGYGQISALDSNVEITNTTDILDVYIVNEQSHTIYYPKGAHEEGGPTEYMLATTYREVSVDEAKFSTAYGRIDVVWLDKQNKVIEKPLTPILNGMTPVKWNGTTEVSTTISDTDWYNYVSIEGTEDNNTSKWANAKDSNGSYFVWVPRYAYRITYYESKTSDVITGYSDGNGITDNHGKVQYPLDNGIKTVSYKGEKYIVHPSFVDGTANEFANGEWDEELSGLWVAKYEMSRTDAVGTTAGIATTFKSVPNVTSARSITIGNMYTYSLDYNTNLESHMMKNSEWGAVAYLTHSQYGRNGTEVTINNSSSYITGNAGNTVSASLASGTTNAYNTEKGQLASSTGNIYGIYDLSGGAYEYVAAWDTLSTSTNVSSYASSFASKNGPSTRYATAYSNGTSSYEPTQAMAKIGDATYEVYTGSNKAWNSDSSNFVYSDRPFFVRGGYYNSTSNTGVFFAYNYLGVSVSYCSFRVCLAVK